MDLAGYFCIFFCFLFSGKKGITSFKRAAETQIIGGRACREATSHTDTAVHADSSQSAVSDSLQEGENVRREPGPLGTITTEACTRA